VTVPDFPRVFPPGNEAYNARCVHARNRAVVALRPNRGGTRWRIARIGEDFRCRAGGAGGCNEKETKQKGRRMRAGPENGLRRVFHILAWLKVDEQLFNQSILILRSDFRKCGCQRPRQRGLTLRTMRPFVRSQTIGPPVSGFNRARSCPRCRRQNRQFFGDFS